MKKISVVLFSLLLLSCSKEEEVVAVDNQNPSIGTVTVANGSEETVLTTDTEAELSLDSTVTVKLSVSDNDGLSQVKVEVHSAFDDHEHRGLATSEKEEEDHEEFSFNKVLSLSGTSDVVEAELWNSSDDNEFEGGDYHIEVVLLDAAGNQHEAVYTVEIEGEEHHEEEHNHVEEVAH